MQGLQSLDVGLAWILSEPVLKIVSTEAVNALSVPKLSVFASLADIALAKSAWREISALSSACSSCKGDERNLEEK